MEFVSYAKKGGNHYYNIPRDSGVLTDAEFDAAVLAERKRAVLERRDYLLKDAAVRIAPLQDAADLGTATNAEASSLLAWKGYRVALSRVHEQPGYPDAVEWPALPSE